MNQCPYFDWAPTTHDWCEEQLCAWIREPANTYSNIAYVIIGILILIQAKKLKGGDLQLLGWFSILLGFMSGFYHATSSFFGEVLDYGSMFLISSYIVTANFSRLYNWTPKKMNLIAMTIFVVSVLALVWLRTVGAFLFGVQIIGSLVIEYVLIRRGHPKPLYRSLLASVGLFTVAWGVWNLDTHKIVCDPKNHFINGHAIWHVTTAIAIYFVFKFYTQFGLKDEK